MPNETTIRRIGDAAGLTIPEDVLERLHLSEGDSVHLIETEEGLFLKPYDPDLAKAMDIYKEGAESYRNALEELAK